MRRSSFSWIVSLGLLGMIAVAQASRAAAGATETAERDLYLDVIVNGASIRLIGAFRQRTNGRLAARANELRELGLKTDQTTAAPDGRIDLDRLVGVTYRYDAVAQVIRFDVALNRLLPRIYDARGSPARNARNLQVQQSDGAVLNYLLFGTTDASSTNLLSFGHGGGTLSGSFDGRLFGRYGVLSQSGILNSQTNSTYGSLRLDSTWTYSDPQSLLSYRAGDFISGGLTWTRPVRLGGFQVQRSFSLRPDLITTPVPALSGTAAVPSTLDVYINNIRTYSRAVPAGPYEIVNLPVISGAGTQRVVVRDSLGRETVTNMPFYTSVKLLQSGLADFSAETGFLRRFYGVQSNDYDSTPAASGSIRYGINDALTLEGHAEGANNLINAGFGAAVPVTTFGVASFALAGSSAGGNSGGLYAASIELGLRGLTFYARSQRSIADYMDLATIASSAQLPNGLPAQLTRPAKAIDQAALTVPLGFDPSSVTLSFTHLQDALDNTHHIVGASYSRPVWRNASFYVTAFSDLAGSRDFGVFAGLTMSLGGGITASTNTSTSRAGTDVGVDLIKSQPLAVDSYGWRLRDREGTSVYREATASYRAPFARVEASVQQVQTAQRATAQMEGAVVYAGGNTFFSNRIDDAFAVVDVGAPNVDVYFENRAVGKTNANGVALVPYLRAYERNRFSIDAKNLPVDADVPRTKDTVVPADRSGAVVKFGISTDTRAALISLKTANGVVIAPGSLGRLQGSDEDFVVGYDGQAFVRGLKDQNTITVTLADGATCSGTFPYVPSPGNQVVIKGVLCR